MNQPPLMTMDEAVPEGTPAPAPVASGHNDSGTHEPNRAGERGGKVAMRTGLNAPAAPVYMGALVAEGLFGMRVDLFDARELNTSQLGAIGAHNRVFIGGRERIACGVLDEDTSPVPLSPILASGALSQNLLVLQETFPDLLIALRSGTLEPANASAAGRTPGWLVELALLSAPNEIVAAGFHPVPEVALFYAALQWAADGPQAERFAMVVGRLDRLFEGATPAAPDRHALH